MSFSSARFALTVALLCGGVDGTQSNAAVPPPPPAIQTAKKVERTPYPLVWDATEKTHAAKPGEVTAKFQFFVTNSGQEKVEIRHIAPSCGCTLAEMPVRPWIIEPGGQSSFGATLDFAGKHGVVSKTLEVESSHGSRTLRVTVTVPEPDEATRRRNQELAAKNRQMVFQNDCAACHAAPLAGKHGAELFTSACGICHLAPSRAVMVPDLAVARVERDEAYWRQWIADGKAGTLMPGFAKVHGGPLDDEQINSLVAYVLQAFPRKPQGLPSLGSPSAVPPPASAGN